MTPSKITEAPVIRALTSEEISKSKPWTQANPGFQVAATLSIRSMPDSTGEQEAGADGVAHLLSRLARNAS